MAALKGTQTEKNILTAFAGESQARNRYTYFASKAKKEGFVQISAIFEETANQEKEHAKRLFKLLEGGEVEITGSFPAGVISSTVENLKGSAAGEHYEHTEMYPEFAKTAKEEGFNDIAAIFMAIAVRKGSTKNDTMILSQTLKLVEFSRETLKKPGAAGIADIYTTEQRRRINALRVTIPRRILSCLGKIINGNQF